MNAPPESAPEPMQQRVLQADGRRYSLKLEPEFWTALSTAAEARGVRSGRLVSDIASSMPRGANLASQIRVFCLADVERRRAIESERASRAELSSGSTDLDAVIEQCPTPCLVASKQQRILRINNGFARWYGATAASLSGKPFDHFFKLQMAQPVDAVFRALGAGRMSSANGQILYVLPGRVVSAPVRLLPVARRADEFSVLMMVAAA